MIDMYPAYEKLIEKAQQSHDRQRSPLNITDSDVSRARLYCYAFRLHAIGAFHATKVALCNSQPISSLAQVHRTRTIEALEDLANQATEPVPSDFRAVITTLFRYHRGVCRVTEGLRCELEADSATDTTQILNQFVKLVETVTNCNGIYLTQDTHAPQQGSFVVPNLGITIVPLVYGDHHSWNLAHLAGENRNVPIHCHKEGVEIHLGYRPTHGQTILDGCSAEIDQGYAMPIAPGTDHGWVNNTNQTHHVPFIFGSSKLGGWGIFSDVTPSTTSIADHKLVQRSSGPFKQMINLEQEIDQARQEPDLFQKTLIAASATHTRETGGLQLSITRVMPSVYTYPTGSYRIISITQGQGLVNIQGIEQHVHPHDHLGVPSKMTCTLKQVGNDPLVVLDAKLLNQDQGK